MMMMDDADNDCKDLIMSFAIDNVNEIDAKMTATTTKIERKKGKKKTHKKKTLDIYSKN